MNLRLDESQRAFRAEVREFIAENLPEESRRGQSLLTGVYPEPAISVPWHRKLAGKGWLAPMWPKEFGGTGWTGFERFIFENECALAGAPYVFPLGLRLVGPVIFTFGTQAQKDRFLPRILTDEDYWCQGFSEPGAGSDLASLTTRAVPDGDDYVVNGSKIWQTHAHHANMMFTLVRTGSGDGPKQAGISFLLIPLDTPGVEVRPIVSIGGDHDVNQVFLSDVRVPKSNLVGEEGKGWDYAKFLLRFERAGSFAAARLRASLKRIGRVLESRMAAGIEIHPDARRRIAEVAIDVDVFEMLELKILGPLAAGEDPGPISSILKLRTSQLKQDVAEAGHLALGEDGAIWPTEVESESDALPGDYLNSRAATIFGGAREVQLGLIAREAFRR